MEKESKAPAGLPFSGLIAIAMLAGGVLFIRAVPLEATRLPVNEPKSQQASSGQDMDARLWQDPFGAVERARQEARKQNPKQAEASDQKRTPGNLLRDMVKSGGKIEVLAVMLQGGPYSEDIETRRRSRYAVLAGLNASGIVPVDAEHLGYFFPRNAREPEPRLPEIVPYEWFESRNERDSDAVLRVLVLWLDDTAFRDAPLQLMANLVKHVKTGEQTPGWRVLGPAVSNGLRAMVTEVLPFPNGKPWPEGALPHFYSAVPTAPDTRIAPQLQSNQSLSDLLAKHGVHLVRTIGDDNQLVNALTKELRLRGLHAGRQRTAHDATCRLRNSDPHVPSHIAIISEWDTLYGRTLGDEFQATPADDGFCVHGASYVRGLDGELPAAAGADGARAKSTQAKPGTEDKSDSRQHDGTYLEIAEGQSQFDYLRRLAKRLTEIDQEIRDGSLDGMGLRAIGVLGSDVHDKLLVLQALQPQFPNAIFFTTDLDARFLHPREKAWTRNLIVASHFNLHLSEIMQPEMPSFRDSYQTSAFLATRLAMDDAQRALTAPAGKASPPEAVATSQETILAWFSEPRLFEIGRTRPFDFSSQSPAAADAADPAAAQAEPAAPAEPAEGTPGSVCKGPEWQYCGAGIHPAPSPLYPKVHMATRLFVASLLVLALWLPPILASRTLRRKLEHVLLARSLAQRVWRWQALAAAFAAVQIGLPLLLAHYWEPFAAWLTLNGKPLVVLEGISLWPTEGIRLLTLLLCVYLVFSGWTALTQNLDDINKRFKLCRARKQLLAEQREANRRLPRWVRFINMFSLRLIRPRDVRYAGPKGPFWRRYIVQNRIGARAVRTTACVLLAAAGSWFLALALHSHSFIPQRGDFSLTVHQWLHVLTFVAIYFLVFFVVDATTFCVSFVRGLQDPPKVHWPDDTLRAFEKELRIPRSCLHGWINLQFIAMRTRCVTRLIYFPFIVLSLFLLSRSAFFDHWTMPTTGLVLMVLGAAVALACAVALRYAAEGARRATIKVLSDEIMRLSGKAPVPRRRLLLNGRRGATRVQAVWQATPAQLALLLERVEHLHEGAFAPFWQQPLLKAILLPFAAFGGTSILDTMALANL